MLSKNDALCISADFTGFNTSISLCIFCLSNNLRNLLSLSFIHSRLGECVAGDSGEGSAKFLGCLHYPFFCSFFVCLAKCSSLLKVFPH